MKTQIGWSYLMIKPTAEEVCKTLELLVMLNCDETPLGSAVYKFCHCREGNENNMKHNHNDWIKQFRKLQMEMELVNMSPNMKAEHGVEL